MVTELSRCWPDAREEIEALFDAGGGGGGGTITANDTDSINMTGNGSGGSPLTADVKLANAPNALSIVTGQGLKAELVESGTRVAILAKRTASTLVPGKWYQSTNTYTFHGVAGVAVRVMASAVNHMSNLAIVLHPNYPEYAWPAVYDFDADTFSEVHDHRNNVVRGDANVRGFPWEATDYGENKVSGANVPTWNVGAVVINLTIEQVTSVDLSGFTGTLLNSKFGPGAVVNVAGGGDLNRVVVEDATLASSNLIGAFVDIEVKTGSTLTANATDGTWSKITVARDSTLNLSNSTVGGDSIESIYSSEIVLTGKTAGSVRDIYAKNDGHILAANAINDFFSFEVWDSTLNINDTDLPIEQVVAHNNTVINLNNSGNLGGVARLTVFGSTVTADHLDGCTISDCFLRADALLSVESSIASTFNALEITQASEVLTPNSNGLTVTQCNVSSNSRISATGGGGTVNGCDLSGNSLLYAPAAGGTCFIGDCVLKSGATLVATNSLAGTIVQNTIENDATLNCSAADFTGAVSSCAVRSFATLDCSTGHAGQTRYMEVRARSTVTARADAGVIIQNGIHAGSAGYTYPSGVSAADVRDQD